MTSTLTCKALVVAVFAAALIQLAIADGCLQCNSREDSRCADSTLNLEPTACANATAFGCFTRIVDGHTVRGCLDTLATGECANDTLCNSCFNVNDAQGCNNQQFPAIRMFCHQCRDGLNSTCADEQTQIPTMCNIYTEDSPCYIRRTNETITRGCLNNDNGGCNTREHCLICNGHGCNLEVHTDPKIPLAPSSAAVNVLSVALLFSTLLQALRSY